VPVVDFDAGLVCTPDTAKMEVLRYLLSRGKHVLVEKPLLAADEQQLRELGDMARSTGAACYTAYNHRFEPHIRSLKRILDAGTLGDVYLVRMFYGNGTAMDVRRSSWRDRASGVLADLGSHLLDMTLFLFGSGVGKFELWNASRFENRAFDHVIFGCKGQPTMVCEATLVSWRNTFTLDVMGKHGSAHINGLSKWGPSTLIVRKRVLPSGVPDEEVRRLKCSDPTWAEEYAHFKRLCATGSSNLENDVWISAVLRGLGRAGGVDLSE
jgi:predicted dehydrogenase